MRYTPEQKQERAQSEPEISYTNVEEDEPVNLRQRSWEDIQPYAYEEAAEEKPAGNTSWETGSGETAPAKKKRKLLPLIIILIVIAAAAVAAVLLLPDLMKGEKKESETAAQTEPAPAEEMNDDEVDEELEKANSAAKTAYDETAKFITEKTSGQPYTIDLHHRLTWSVENWNNDITYELFNVIRISDVRAHPDNYDELAVRIVYSLADNGIKSGSVYLGSNYDSFYILYTESETVPVSGSESERSKYVTGRYPDPPAGRSDMPAFGS